MRSTKRIVLFGIIAFVCLMTLLGYISSLVCDLSAFWVDPVPLFTTILGVYFSNLDMATVGTPICGICLMLIYIDMKNRRDQR